MGSLDFRPDRLAAFLAGQCFYLLPWVWFFLMAAAWKRKGLLFAASRSESGPAQAFLLAHALPPIAIFTTLACFRPVLPHWSLPGFLCLMPMAAVDWAQGVGRSPGPDTTPHGLSALGRVGRSLGLRGPDALGRSDSRQPDNCRAGRLGSRPNA